MVTSNEILMIITIIVCASTAAMSQPVFDNLRIFHGSLARWAKATYKSLLNVGEIPESIPIRFLKGINGIECCRNARLD
jgi:hypothetical protein